MDIVEFFEDVERNDLQHLLTNPRAKHTEKKDKLTSAFIQASKTVWRQCGRSLTDDERKQVIHDAERTYNREMRQKRKTAFKQIAAAL
jgi:F0F1-type ATP synthase delta subunit